MAYFTDSPFYRKFRSKREEDLQEYVVSTVIHLCGDNVLEDPRYQAPSCIEYEYDFGAAWHHDVILKGTIDSAEQIACTKGNGEVPNEKSENQLGTPFDKDIINGKLSKIKTGLAYRYKTVAHHRPPQRNRASVGRVRSPVLEAADPYPCPPRQVPVAYSPSHHA